MADISESRQQSVVEAIKKKIKSETPLLAQHIGIPSGVEKRSSQQERLDYWTPDPEVLRDPMRFQNEAAAAAMSTAREGEPVEMTARRTELFFVNRLYPARLNLIRSGARALSVKAQIDFADEQERLGPPEQEEI
jgi:uncharacterized protein (DUF1684 family)